MQHSSPVYRRGFLYRHRVSSDQTYVFPAPGGAIEVRTGANFHAAVMVFDNDYGSCEFARGPLTSVLEQVVQVIKEGVTFGPRHEPGAPFRWYYFPHDDSYRASVHDGEFRIIRHAGLRIGVHVRREGCSVMGVDDDLPLLFAHMENSVQSLRLHVPLTIVHKGRRFVLKVASGADEVFACQIDASMRYAVTFGQIDLSPSASVHVMRTVDGISVCVKSYTKDENFDGYDGILWSEAGSSKQAKPLQLQASREGTQPSGPLTTGIAKALDAVLRHMSELGGVGKTLLRPLGNIFRRIAASGKRVRGRGSDLKKALEIQGNEKIPGGDRVFRYAMATCRRLGLLICDGTLEAFAFDDSYDPATEFARHLMCTYGTTEPQVEASVTGQLDRARFGLESIDGGPPASPAPTSAPSVGSPHDDRPPPSDHQPPPAPASLPVGMWPHHDATPDNSLCTPPCVMDDTSRLTGSVQCYPHGRAGDQVNWFRHQVHTPGEFAFNGTTLGDDYLTKDNLSGEEFYRNLRQDVEEMKRRSSA